MKKFILGATLLLLVSGCSPSSAEEMLWQPLAEQGDEQTEQGNYKKATGFYERAVQIQEMTAPKTDEYPNLLNKLAAVHQKQNHFKEAEKYYQKALDFDKSRYSKNNPAVASDLNNLATLYNREGKPEKAEALFRQALKIDEDYDTEDNFLNIAIDMQNLAYTLHIQEKFKEAEPLYLKALELKEAKLGSDAPELATTLYNLSMLYKQTGRLDESKRLEMRAKEIEHDD